MRAVLSLSLALLTGLIAAAAEASSPRSNPGQSAGGSAREKREFELVKIPDGKLTIFGALWKPAGAGPFPALVYNHGSESLNALDAAPDHGYGSVGAFYRNHGFVCLIPLRRGHSFALGGKTLSTSPGEYFADRVEEQAPAGREGVRSLRRRQVWLHEQDVDSDDVSAAVRWLKAQPFVAPQQLLMSGISFGGIQTILAAQKNEGLCGFVPFAPGAMSWRGCPELHERLKVAIERAKAPVFLIQASNDFSTGPSEFLSPVIDAKGAPSRHKLYPAFLPERGVRAGHSGFATWPAGIDIWSADVLSFEKDVLGHKLASGQSK